MQGLYKIIIILGLIALTLGGLNIANQGLNELTLDQHPPIFSLCQDEEDLVFCTLGQVHTLEREEIQQWKTKLRSSYVHMKDYLQYWWSVFSQRES